jgi:alpha/beta superfamily hydrolase
MKKVVYIIPGYGEHTGMKGYQAAMKIFRLRGITPIPVNIHWKYKVMNDYVDEFLSVYKKNTGDDVYLFGFSFGAMIACIAAAQLKPKKIYLCSLSPYFREDLKSIKKSWRTILGKKRMTDFANFSFDALAQNVSCKVVLLFGDKEHPLVEKRVADAQKKLKKSKVFVAQGANHNLGQKEYIDLLKTYL